MKNPLVSVVIPTYRRPLQLKNAIDSVLQQSYKNIEIVIVDDNNLFDSLHDETKKVVNSYDNEKRIKFVIQGVQKGANAARNAGITASSGLLIAFLDDDDIWLDEKIKSQVELFEENNDLSFVYCNLLVTYNGEGDYVTEFNNETCKYESLLKRGEGVNASAFIIKRDVLIKLKGFDVSLKSLTDYEIQLRLSREYKHSLVMKPLVKYLVNPDGISMNYNSKFLGKKKVLSMYKEEYIRLGLRSFYSKQNSLLGQYAILSGRKRFAFKYWGVSIINNPVQFKSYISIIVVSVGGAWLYNVLSKIYYMSRKIIN
mgnify:CR=1 FL=1